GHYDESLITSKHAVNIQDKQGSPISSCILLSSGGGPGIHENTAITHDDSIIIAVGAFLACLSVPSLKLKWETQADEGTCFGVHHSTIKQCYISHGELEISRLNYDGEIEWKFSGKDIFTGELNIVGDTIEVSDFNNENYAIDINSGKGRLIPGGARQV
ncbi:MAG: hypothetical protein N2C13_03225, partial [Chloroflexota bacterium]